MFDIAFEDSGPANSDTIVLLYGWSGSVQTWDAVTSVLSAIGE